MSPGIKREDRNPVKAVSECEAAVPNYPGSARKAGRQPEAVACSKRAAARGYVAVSSLSGRASLEGEGITKDEAQGFHLIKLVIKLAAHRMASS